ncbi:hypothetical protein GcM1_167015 [Golovinomyces cichoracearum]|uniref:Uncharacterized protein n=1 Tax=Golovinomyces cichoracearum TaxID=62708 RepID=A0A420J7N4_9PEZI|nr:hypothetical protein GcM1_167015 [Golovinomyces cichoracearum]
MKFNTFSSCDFKTSRLQDFHNKTKYSIPSEGYDNFYKRRQQPHNTSISKKFRSQTEFKPFYQLSLNLLTDL